MKRWLLAVGVLLLVVAVLCLVLGTFVRIIICDYPGCDDERTETMVRWYAAGAVSGLAGGFALFHASRRGL